MTTPTVRNHYGKLAPTYDRRWKRYLDKTIGLATEAVSFSRREAVLDVACGTGELERRLLELSPGISLSAIDLSPAMLAHARRKPFADQVAWIESEVSRIPFPENAFDYVFCVNAFHYFREPDKALEECLRVLRPAGTLRIVDWCDDFLLCKLCSLWLRITNPAFYRTYTQTGCSAMLREAGFRVKDTQRRRIDLIWGMMSITAEKKELSRT